MNDPALGDDMEARIAAEDIWRDLEAIRSRRPLVVNITNQVAINLTANALLALGASPIMTSSRRELAELLDPAAALVLNIGTLDGKQYELMLRAGELAARRSLPIILDPVGAGASWFRTEAAMDILKRLHPAVIRGNASEILTLAGQAGQTKGVDSQKESLEAVEGATDLARRMGCRVCISGGTDIATDGRITVRIANGHPLMGRITGLGCSATAMIGAFAAVNTDRLAAAVGAMAVLGVCGELAAEASQGPASLQTAILDRLWTLGWGEFSGQARIG